jgi:proteasome lid subunit RPN8/RPN11
MTLANASAVDQLIEELEPVNRRSVYPHVFENADREVGGVLVGHIDARTRRPTVTAAIAALAADEQRATLTFTQQAWEHVHRVLDRDHPGQQIVGWYHSHPGFGIFLSEHDLFIHRNFFSGRSQIALVVDPLAGTEGVFGWREQAVSELYVGPTPPDWPGLGTHRPAPRPPRRVVEVPPTAASEPPRRQIAPLVVAVIAGLVLGVLGSRLAFSRESDPPVPPTPPVPARTATPTPSRTPTPSPTATETPPRKTPAPDPKIAPRDKATPRPKKQAPTPHGSPIPPAGEGGGVGLSEPIRLGNADASARATGEPTRDLERAR